jgi:hypothetical protein
VNDRERDAQVTQKVIALFEANLTLEEVKWIKEYWNEFDIHHVGCAAFKRMGGKDDF